MDALISPPAVRDAAIRWSAKDELKDYTTAGVRALLDAALAERAAYTKRIAAIRAELQRRERGRVA
jgi:hypothetical protein